MRIYLLSIFIFLTLNIIAQNQPPEISNLVVLVDEDNHFITINYDLYDAENEEMQVQFFISNDGGQTYNIDIVNAIGDIGSSIFSGSNKSISWDASGILNEEVTYQVKLIADDLYEINIQEIVDQVDSSRLRKNLQFIEGIRHRNSNPAHLEAIKDSIEQRFISENLHSYRQNFPYGNYTGQNIIGRLEGSIHSDSTYIIDGHFDTVGGSPGADDNGSAVAGMLEALHVLSPYHFDKTLRFISFDLEEAGLIGSSAYTENGIPPSEIIKGVFNMEMIGYYSEEPNSQTFPAGFGFLYPEVQADMIANQYRGNFITSIGSQNSLALLNAYNEAAAKYISDLKIISLIAPTAWQSITPDFGRSDHAPFWLKNIPALMLTDGSNFRNPNYHTQNDLIATLDFDFMTQVVKAVVGSVAEVAGVSHCDIAIAEFSVTTGNENVLDCDFHVAPIPADDKLQLFMDDCNLGRLIIQLFDNMGRLVMEDEFSNGIQENIKLDLTKLEGGLYILKISDGKRNLQKKVLVN